MSESDIILKGINLVKEYFPGKKTSVRALNDVTIDVRKGELVLLFGVSGSGKSTLLNCLSGLDQPSEGKVLFKDENIADWDEERLAKFRRDNSGFVFQAWELIPTLTALENVEIPLYPLKIKGKEIQQRSVSLLKQVGLFDRVDHYPGEMSGGEQQRCAVARALASRPAILFADEPTGNLDEETGENIMRLLERIANRGTAVLVASHNEGLGRYARRTLRMRSGSISS